ncbi:MAG: zinc-ribbon domain-containing protein [Gemmatimonadota bacterium]
MNVTCPGCNTIYRVDPAKVPVQGVRARCQVCATVFAVRRPVEEAAARLSSTEPATLVRPMVARPSMLPPAPEPPAPPAPMVVAPPITEPPPAPPTRAPEPIREAPVRSPVYEAPPPRAPEPATEPSIRIPTFEAPPPAAITEPTIPVPAYDSPSAPPMPRATEPRLAQPVSPAAPFRPPVLQPPLRPTAPASHPGLPAGPPLIRPPAPAGSPPLGSPTRAANPFLTQDPNQKARRLARALISDLAVYFPDRRKKALAAGTLKAEFEEEIRKSWDEFTDQVGKPMAESTTHFTDALNEILASGQKIF